MTKSNFQLHSRPEYYQALIEHATAATAGDSLTLMTMNFDPRNAIIAKLVNALRQAAQRGATVRLFVDAMDLILDQNSRPGPLFYGRPLVADGDGTAHDTFRVLEELKASGGHYWIINQPTKRYANPVAGRSHIKIAIFNDLVYLGGCNLENEDLIDMMVSWPDPAAAKWLYTMTEEIAVTGNVRQALHGTDRQFAVSDVATILVDSGVKKQSIIYPAALKYIDQAKEFVTITCQYFPGGPTARRLLAASKRGAQITIYFSGPKTHSQPLGHYLYNFRERLRMPAAFFTRQLPATSQRLHAKLIVTDQAVIIGSHNYVNIGTNLGTAEIALKVDDPAFARQALEKLATLLPEV